MTLKGKARAWVDGKVFANFAELKDQFIRKFGGAHSREGAVEKFNNCIYNFPEPVEDYLMRIKEWAQILNYGAELVRDRFFAGLPDDLRGMAHLANIADLDELVKAVQNYVTSKSKSTTAVTTFLAQPDCYEQFDKIEEKLEMLCLAQNKSSDQSVRNNDRGRQRERWSKNNTGKKWNRSNSRDRYSSRERSRERNYSKDRRDYSNDRYYRGRERNYSNDRRDYSNDRYYKGKNRDYSRDRYKSKYASPPTVSFEKQDF